MDNDNNYWDTPISDKTRSELDEDLIEKLNTMPEELPEPKKTVNNLYKIVAIISVFLFLFLASNQLISFFKLPSLDFIDRSRELRQDGVLQELRAAVVEVTVGNARGTGFNIDPNGVIVTNYHVIDHEGEITIHFPQGRPYVGTITARFPEVDLVMISIAGEGLPVLPTTTVAEPQAGDAVTIIGHPLGYSHIIVEGEVVGTTTLAGWDAPVLVISAPIYKGSSGSPVIDSTGKVIAVIFATSTMEAVEEEIIGFAIPIHYVYE
ncbi:MAG: serine protease [Firmicutes bacterium]|nr:serine protease [Bacillota bacterium]